MSIDRTSNAISIAKDIESWCHAVRQYQGEIHSKLIFHVIKRLAPVLRSAIEENLTLNLVTIGQRLAEAGKFVVSEQEAIVGLAGALPRPEYLDSAAQQTLAQVLGIVEHALPNTFNLIKDHWALERLRAPVVTL